MRTLTKRQKRGHTTGKQLFENNLVDSVMKECRRRKVGKWIVLSHVVRVMNALRDDQRYEWSLEEKPAGKGTVKT